MLVTSLSYHQQGMVVGKRPLGSADHPTNSEQ